MDGQRTSGSGTAHGEGRKQEEVKVIPCLGKTPDRGFPVRVVLETHSHTKGCC